MTVVKVIIKGSLNDATTEAAKYGLQFTPSSYTNKEQIGTVSGDDAFKKFMKWAMAFGDGAPPFRAGTLLWYKLGDEK